MAEKTLFLAGDVVTARGLDQILPDPVDPALFEPYVRDARAYVELAKRAGARIPDHPSFGYVWGDALEIWDEVGPDARIVNLETSITRHAEPWPGKQVNYRMSPGNIQCLRAAALEICALGNNHVLDWGYEGLGETVATLDEAGLNHAGAGEDAEAAAKPATTDLGDDCRLLVWSLASPTSGVPPEWAAAAHRAGVNFLRRLDGETATSVAESVGAQRRSGDVVVVSVHWGENWGFAVPDGQKAFAHRLLESGAVDIVHGHSSHHVKGIEVYRGKLILYGCGDLLNDYEGIRGLEDFRGDLGLMYFARVDVSSGDLVALEMNPTRIKHFRINRAKADETSWLRMTLDREGERFGSRVNVGADGKLLLGWKA
jgi:poly-gamma-glutamate synthesis protein (capsule biosynthesis protein)